MPPFPTILDRIGNTPLLELQHLAPKGCARLLVKLATENPTGSMKDRMALAMIRSAESDGRLPKGGAVVEYTGGSTGVSLALVCQRTGHPLTIVTSDAFSIEKRRHMEALGATLVIIASQNGGMDAGLTRSMVSKAQEIAAETDAFLTDQLANPDQIDAYRAMGKEIWDQTRGQIDGFVQATGTAASVRGVSETLHAQNRNIRCIAVEPAESAVLSGGSSGTHRIEGAGAGYVVPLWRRESVDGIVTVSTEAAMAMARRLATEEGVFAGTSSGANLVAAIRLGVDLGAEATVVTIICDSGMKYLSTPLYTGSA